MSEINDHHPIHIALEKGLTVKKMTLQFAEIR